MVACTSPQVWSADRAFDELYRELFVASSTELKGQLEFVQKLRNGGSRVTRTPFANAVGSQTVRRREIQVPHQQGIERHFRELGIRTVGIAGPESSLYVPMYPGCGTSRYE